MWLRPQTSRSSFTIGKAFWHGAYQLAAVELMASTLIHPYSEHLSRRLTVFADRLKYLLSLETR